MTDDRITVTVVDHVQIVEVDDLGDPDRVVVVEAPERITVELVDGVPVPGPPGPQGPPGSAHVHVQTAPAATWTITHGLGRVPVPVVLDPAGHMVIADLALSATTAVVTHAQPRAGQAVLT